MESSVASGPASPGNKACASGSGWRVAVVGATGAVGSVVLDILHERGFPAREMVPFASERSTGRRLEARTPPGLVAEVRPLTAESIQGFDLSLVSAGSGCSRAWAPRFLESRGA